MTAKKRKDYTGPYADFASRITVPNSSPQVRNSEILAYAKETKEDFYRTAFTALDELNKKHATNNE